MIRIKTKSAVLLATIVLCSSATAQERILSFHSNIVVQEDGSIRVTETILVVAQGNEIRRGIFRDIPLATSGVGTVLDRATLEIESVRRNQNEEPYHIQKDWEAWRIYIGEEEVFIPHGEHTYELTYTSRFQLGYLEGYDELYWNVTGNYWSFPIEAASATIHLPEPVAAENLRVYAYTGHAGSQGDDYTIDISSPGVVHFETTRPFMAQEGLTIAVGFPKGVVAPPPTRANAL